MMIMTGTMLVNTLMMELTTALGMRVLSSTYWKKEAVAMTNMICAVDLAVAQKMPGRSLSLIFLYLKMPSSAA